jgi:hypothetical protein
MPSWQTRKSNPAQRQPEPPISAALERYDFGLKPVVLGRGASATVYKVTDKHLRRAVALKVFREEDSFTDNELTSLASLASLGGPNLVSFTDHGRIRVPGDERALPFIAMEYWQGTTLKDDAPSHVSWENATPEDASKWCEDTVEVIRQCFAGINQLHQGQVKHLDIKPSNIFITREPNGSVMAAKILDLGLSSFVRVSDQRGTPLYMAPEQAVGEDVTESADVFSMGIVAYELLTRRHPFADRPSSIDLEALVRNVATVAPASIKELNPHVPDAVALVVHKTLAKDPKDRPGSGEVWRMLKSGVVFTEQAHTLRPTIGAARALYEAGELESASEKLWELERKGWAFPEMVELRARISAARCDKEVALRIAEVREHFRRNDLAAAHVELAAAQDQRRFDPRVLLAEAEYEFRLEQLDRVAEDVAAVEEALAQGYSRQAWWRSEILSIRQDADPYRNEKNSDHVRDLRSRLQKALTDEEAWLTHVTELIRNGRFVEAETACTQIGASVLPTSAVLAQQLEVRAQRYRLLLQNTLLTLDSTGREERARLTARIAAASDQTPDALAECVRLLQQRNDLIAEVGDRALACNAASDLVGELDLIETLLRISPDERLRAQQADLQRVLLRELAEQRVAFALASIRRVVELGDWERARTLIDAVALEFSENRELNELKSRAAVQLQRADARSTELETILGHLRRAEIPEALQALRAAQQANPESIVLAISLAAYLGVEANRLKRSGDVSAALRLEDEQHNVMRAREKSPLLKRARDALLHRAEPEPASGSADSSASASATPSSAGAAQSGEPALSVSASLPGAAVSSPVPAEATPTKTGFMRRLISRSPAPAREPAVPVEAASPAPVTEPAEVVEWERGPDGRPRRKR